MSPESTPLFKPDNFINYPHTEPVEAKADISHKNIMYEETLSGEWMAFLCTLS